MRIIRKIVISTLFAVIGGIFIGFAAFPAESVYAQKYDISEYDITIHYSSGEQMVNISADNDEVIEIYRSKTNTPSTKKIVINTVSGCTAKVRLSDVDIDLSDQAGAAVEITGDGDAIIEISGNNILRSGFGCAGIEKNARESNGSLEICGTGSLTAAGGNHGAGIGGGNSEASSNITITGGEITATGGSMGAGIGGGDGGAGSKITVTGGTVAATGGDNAAGIGGGDGGAGSKIAITGGEVTATGGSIGAGIGGGSKGAGSKIEITGGTVIATAGGSSEGGAGIGGGCGSDGISCDGSDIKISGGTVSANGGGYGAGIGGGGGRGLSGVGGAGFKIEITGGTVTAAGGIYGSGIGGGSSPSTAVGAGSEIKITGGTVTAIGGTSGAGIGGGFFGAGSNITITGGTVCASGGISGAGIGGGLNSTGSDIRINNDAKVMAAGGRAATYGAGAAIGNGGQSSGVSGNEIEPDISGLYDTGYIMYFAAGTSADAMIKGKAAPTDTIRGKIISPKTITFDPNGGTCATKTAKTVSSNNGSQVLSSLPVATRDGYTFDGWYTAKEGGDKITKNTVFSGDTTVYAHWTKKEPSPEPKPEPNPEPEPDPTPTPAPDPAMDNLPSEITSVTKGDYRITFAGKIPFPGKSKVTVKNFGEAFSVSQGNATYTVTKIKVNKKKKLIQITGLENADKKIVKEVKKATKGADGLSFDYTPYYVKDTDKVDPKFRKDELKSVKILINGKLYKAKNTEYEYDKEKKVITFKAPNLGGSYKVP